MDLSLRGIVRSRYGLASGFSVVNDALGRAKNDIGEDFYRTVNGSVSVRFLLTTLVGMLTQHHNHRRTGGFLNEVLLHTSNVNQQQFGKLFTRQVDGQIYAQPLYLPNVNIPGQGIHNVVYVATMHNTVYAFDADDPHASTPLWSTSIGPPVPLPDPRIGTGHKEIEHEVGVVSTPVISPKHNALYVVGTVETPDILHSIHALDLATGQEKFGGPVVISGSAQGTGDGSVNGSITFTSHLQIQRAALLLANGNVYIAFAAYGDRPPYHGWVFAYSADTLQGVASYNTTPNGRGGGIWQAGQGPSADGNNCLYFLTGNGTFLSDGSALGDSFVKLQPDLTLADWFSPFNNNSLDGSDADLGASGVLLIPDTTLALGGGKEGKLYLVDTQNMGKFNPKNDNQIVQSFYVNQNHHIHGAPVYWDGPNGPWIYVWPENDYMKAYQLTNGQFQTTPVSQITTTAPAGVPGGSPGMPGGMLSISAHGNTAGTGIVWASHPYDKDANNQVVEGILHAYDASDLTTELWNSKENPNRDDIGLFAKFCPPTIANGKVYMATFSGYLAVYGLL